MTVYVDDMRRMTARPAFAVESQTLRHGVDADEVIALALSIIRGRVFGSRAAEVRMIRLALEKMGFRIVDIRNECK